MRWPLALLLISAAGLAGASPRPDMARPISWYNGNVKTDIYFHPSLCVRLAKKDMLQDSNMLGERDGWRIYPARGNMHNKGCLPFYSSRPDWKKSNVIYAQDSGVLVQFKQGVTESEIQQLFNRENVQGERRSLPQAYFIKDIQGEKAVRLSERLFKSGKVKFSHPNWLGQAIPG